MRKMLFSICITLLLSGAAVWSFSGCERKKQPSTRESSAGDQAKRFVTIEALLAEVENLCKDWKYKDAYDVCRQIVQRQPGNSDGWFWLGFTAHRRLLPKEAKEAYLKTIELNPEYVRAYLNLGILYGQHGRYLDAIKYYRDALTKNPNSWEAYAGLGDVYRENAAYQKAIENYERAVKLNPKEPRKEQLAQRYIELCQDAQSELAKSGVVSARTLKRLADISFTPPDYYKGLLPPPGVTPFQVRFGRGSSNLSKNDQRQLEEVAQLLKEWQGRRFVVEGYTCPCGSVEANRELSLRRAETVKAYLIQHTPISAENLFVRGYGEENPIFESRYQDLSAQECERDEEHLMNRRVLLRIWLQKEPPLADPLNILKDER